jgi:ATP-binding cassette, subfamily B, bacterial
MVGTGMAGGFWGSGLGGGSLRGGGTPKGSLDGKGFSQVPVELRDQAEKIQAREAEQARRSGWDEPDLTFSHQPERDRRPLTLWRVVGLTRWAGAGLFLVIAAETLSLQAGPALIQIGIDGLLQRKPMVIVAAGLAAVGAVLLTVLFSRTRGTWTGRRAAGAMFRLRLRVFTHLQRLSLDYYTREKAGVILTRMMSDIEALQHLLQDGLAQFATQLLTMTAIGVFLFAYDARLALITLGVVVPALLLLSAWFRRVSDRGYLRVRDGIAGVLGDLSETLQGIRVVAGHNRQAHNVVHHRNVVGTYRQANDYTARNAALYGPSTEFIGIAGQILVLLVGGLMVRDGELSVGVLTAFVLYIGTFFQPIQQMVQTYDSYQSGKAAIGKLRELLETEPSVVEAPDAHELPPVKGDIVFDGVTFGYVDGAPVLHDVNLHLRAGQTVAFVGPTGAGKSTIAKLICRFYDPTSGSVRLDGHDLRAVTIGSLRRQLGVVPQEPFLFAGSIRDNVRFARPGADEEEILRAVHVVGLDELVASLPEGLDTPVHERGVSLSAGERQLIALARTFVARPRVLVLDEATSSLDLRSERQVEAALDRIVEGRTAIIVAHRLTTAMRADRVVVIDEGVVVEDGTHAELVERGGRYAAMFEIWARHSRDGALTR